MLRPAPPSGDVIDANLRRERITLDELASQARLQKIATFREIEWAILEKNGQISFIEKKPD